MQFFQRKGIKTIKIRLTKTSQQNLCPNFIDIKPFLQNKFNTKPDTIDFYLKTVGVQL